MGPAISNDDVLSAFVIILFAVADAAPPATGAPPVARRARGIGELDAGVAERFLAGRARGYLA
jgi:hypothetical protein